MKPITSVTAESVLPKNNNNTPIIKSIIEIVKRLIII
jgi:hypothetical protein